MPEALAQAMQAVIRVKATNYVNATARLSARAQPVIASKRAGADLEEFHKKSTLGLIPSAPTE